MFRSRAAGTFAVSLALLGLAPACGATEVRVLSFSFELPDFWYVEGGGGDALFATGSPGSFEPYSPPWTIATGCVPTSKKSCESFRRPDPQNELEKMGCGQMTSRSILHENNIAETRWTCPAFTIQGQQVTFATSLFEIDGALLYVGYMGGSADTVGPKFMERLGNSMKWIPSQVERE